MSVTEVMRTVTPPSVGLVGKFATLLILFLTAAGLTNAQRYTPRDPCVAGPVGVVHARACGPLGMTVPPSGPTARLQEEEAPESMTYSVLYTFTGGADGSNPNQYASAGEGLIRDRRGNLYGTTTNGGDVNGYCGVVGCGLVFKLDTAGIETVLYSFTGPPDGAAPGARLVADPEGNLYGTTPGGGTAALPAGTVFKLDPAGNESVLYSFTGGVDGSTLYSGVVRDKEGNLYGTTTAGGASGFGVVYKVDPAGNETVLYSFGADGKEPNAGVIRDKEGNLYGTTFFGGASKQGTVFRLDPTGKETVLHSFTGPDGASPVANLVRDEEGNLYGTASAGGDLNGVCASYAPAGCGVVFKLDPAGIETVLYTFTGVRDGALPYGRLLLSAGKLYGTAFFGGDLRCNPGFGCGVVFKLDRIGKLVVLHTFTGGADGGSPTVGLIADPAGNLYGTTANGGDLAATNPVCGGFGCGVVFKLAPR